MLWALEMYTLRILAVVLISLTQCKIFIAPKGEYFLAESISRATESTREERVSDLYQD